MRLIWMEIRFVGGPMILENELLLLFLYSIYNLEMILVVVWIVSVLFIAGEKIIMIKYLQFQQEPIYLWMLGMNMLV